VVPPLQRARTWKLGVLAVAVEPFFLEWGEVGPVKVEEAEVHGDAAGREAVEVGACRETFEVVVRNISHPRHLIHPLGTVGQEALMAA
jgi:hypothetical protein